ncbi:uncharacterized protein LOC119167931 [Rhipicephalus microplus]|uniref:uncharacterized protein LOC119167931 n=1 Tax=Rhipicephalus microplus TaxID=6941 RepID=UPI003F6C7D09
MMLGVIALATLLVHYTEVKSASPPARQTSVKGVSGKLPGLQGETKYPPGLGGTAPSPEKTKPKYLCGHAYSCNFGTKRTCLLTDGIKSPVMCVQPAQTCETVWAAYCVRPLIPICKNEATECLCSCGKDNGLFRWF